MIVSNTSWTVYNFRKELIKSLIASGFQVHVVSYDDGYKSHLIDLGCDFTNIPIKGSSLNPFNDVALFINLRKVYRKHRPDLLMHFTIKPVIYGSLAASSLGIPTVNNIAGLGSIFSAFTWKTRLVLWLYKISQSKVKVTFFQNKEEQELFQSNKIALKGKSIRIKGSGVNTEYFIPNTKIESGEFSFMFFGRILWQEGIGEFEKAAKQLTQKYPKVKFNVLGIVGFDNPSSISQEVVTRWEKEKVINFLGRVDDVLPTLQNTDCVVLPSYYREGVPRSLIEAASAGIPIITTDHVGCRDIVKDSYNGFLVEKQSVEDLVVKMDAMLNLNYSERVKMGLNGRDLVLKEFDVNAISKIYIDEISEVLSKQRVQN